MYMAYTVVAEGLTKTFGDHRVLDGVDLAIEAGSVFALLGPNGAGKTTTVRILATLVRPDAGTAAIAGHDLLSDPLGVRRVISLTGQYAAVDEVLTGRENLEMMGQLLHLPRPMVRRRSDELLRQFELVDAADRRVKTYSGGMRRRLDLAISVIKRPRLLVLDEPTSGLDPLSRETLWSYVRDLVDEGVTVLLTTQYLEEADQLADTVAVLQGGRIAAQGTPDELKSGIGAEVVRLHFGDGETLSRARSHLEAATANERLRTLDVVTDGAAETMLRLLDDLVAAGAPAAKVSTYRPTLDDVFRSLISDPCPEPAPQEVVR
jgi:ABC-2 type transport system ATP-binding protein